MPHMYLFAPSKFGPGSSSKFKPNQKSDFTLPEEQHTEFDHGVDVHFLTKWVQESLKWIQANGRVKQSCADFAPIRGAVDLGGLCKNPARCEYKSDVSSCKVDGAHESCKM